MIPPEVLPNKVSEAVLCSTQQVSKDEIRSSPSERKPKCMPKRPISPSHLQSINHNFKKIAGHHISSSREPVSLPCQHLLKAMLNTIKESSNRAGQPKSSVQHDRYAKHTELPSATSFQPVPSARSFSLFPNQHAKDTFPRTNDTNCHTGTATKTKMASSLMSMRGVSPLLCFVVLSPDGDHRFSDRE